MLPAPFSAVHNGQRHADWHPACRFEWDVLCKLALLVERTALS
jgi:hypothetical protein